MNSKKNNIETYFSKIDMDFVMKPLSLISGSRFYWVEQEQFQGIFLTTCLDIYDVLGVNVHLVSRCLSKAS